VTHSLRAELAVLDLGGREVRSWAYDGRLPGAPIRVEVGDELRVSLSSDLPAPTTIHWHGIALRNDMDGVPGLTTPQVEAGQVFEYAFTVPDPGTYWFHPHVGVQLDTGLYAPLIVDDPNEPGGYDDEAVLVLDDWTDGWGESPDQILGTARRDGMGGMQGMDGMSGMPGMDGMDHMGMPSAAQPLGSDTGDVRYPAHLINGRLPTAPHTITASPGRRIRLRIINAGSDTPYRFAIGGHRLTVTHTDGFPVEPVDVDTVIIGMGERYDVVITAGDGVFP
jgi:FtsP/CotA-like multicopper oxidase with cupredoxin domain